MKNNLEFLNFSQEELEKIRKRSILECYNWWGHRYPGFKGMIVTEDYEMYSYNYYERVPENLQNNNVNYIAKNKILTEREIRKLKNFIENELINKEYQNVSMRDVWYDVIVNYNGVSKTISNNVGITGQILIYDKTEKLMKNILEARESVISKIFYKIKNLFKRDIKQIAANSKKVGNIGEIFENELLEKHGKCNQLQHYGLKILFITDTHNCLSSLEEEIENLKKLKDTDYDICFTLGDISAADFNIIKSIIPKEKIYGIVGNHDSIDALEVNDIRNINGQIIECKGVKIAAIMGSNKYKDGDYGMMTQEECLELEQNMEKADILISHDKAYVWDKHDNVHDGLKGITDYIYRNNIPLHIHGHLHEEYEETLKNGTKSMCLYQIKLIEI